MIRWLLSWSALPMLLAVTCPLHAEVPADTTAIHLPGIIHTWRKPGDEALSETTIDEVSKCMGKEMNIQARASEFDGRQQQLEAEFAGLKSKSEAIRQVAEAISAETAEFEQSAKLFKSGDADLESRKALIQELKANRKLRAGEVGKLNALIASYNDDVAERNRRQAKMLMAERQLKDKIAAHNVAVREVNELVARFNERNMAFNSDAGRFNEELAHYSARCTGVKILKE